MIKESQRKRTQVSKMNGKTEAAAWETLSREEKQRRLFLRQKELLDKFLERGAISRAQYEPSLAALTAGREEAT